MSRKRILVLLPLLALSAVSAALPFRVWKKPLAVTLHADAAAANAGLETATGAAFLLEDLGRVQIHVDLGGAQLPPGTVLEGWVVDAGLLGGPGTTSASTADEVYGTPFGNAMFDEFVDNAPYALSTGALERHGKEYVVNFRINNNLTPYDAVVVTLEADGNGQGYDPRPGSIVVAGPILR